LCACVHATWRVIEKMELSSNNGGQDDGVEKMHLTESILGPEDYKKTGNKVLNNEDVKKMIIELAKFIDRFNSDYKLAKDLVLEIARKLDESGTCPTNQI